MIPGSAFSHILANINNYALGLAGIVLLLFVVLLLGPVMPERHATNPFWAPFKRVADYVLAPDKGHQIARRFLYVTLALEALFVILYEVMQAL